MPTSPTLAARASSIRRASLRMVHARGMGHPGGDLSAADILATLFCHVLRIDPRTRRSRARPVHPQQGARVGGALRGAGRGRLPLDERPATYMQPLSRLNGHPDRNKVPGVEANTGPLGHGLPIAVGAALAGRMEGAPGAPSC
jgi:transketolase